ncbi:hypothetical protein [Amphritea balenae]|uniref:Uncharacterized protein n=1 Tax=Amphritea balenae TaxID=452629 RepID=A0A3P1SRJ4_9GAMM|nr:hypothetical protein [Amphritea balenae]RRC99720.1 hypothetical protein EHS89_09535 [Amphritea balenae]GGK79296.1 hypothetical protein GCM10007941_31920 [Amphritea balenae]
MSNDINQISQINSQIEAYFDGIEHTIFNGSMFAPWRGSFEVKKVYIKKDNADIKCDLDVRLQHWPEGVVVKVYKHKALAALPSVNNADIAREFLKQEPVPSKFWKETFYFSHRTDLDDARYVLREGNDMTPADADTCLTMLKGFIEEIEAILN